MPDLHAEAEALFAAYLTAWNARDAAGVAALFDEPATYVLPETSIAAQDRAAVTALLDGLFARLVADGFDHSTIGAVSARAAGPTLAVLDVEDIRRVRADGSVMEAIDGHYVLRKVSGDWRFAVAVVCARGWRAG